MTVSNHIREWCNKQASNFNIQRRGFKKHQVSNAMPLIQLLNAELGKRNREPSIIWLIKEVCYIKQLKSFNHLFSLQHLCHNQAQGGKRGSTTFLFNSFVHHSVTLCLTDALCFSDIAAPVNTTCAPSSHIM